MVLGARSYKCKWFTIRNYRLIAIVNMVHIIETGPIRRVIG